MTVPSITLKELRHRICREERMPFFLRYKEGQLEMTGVPTTTTIPCASLTQQNSFWVGQWILITSGDNEGEERRITVFVQATGLLTLEYPLPNLSVAGDEFEIVAMWPPSLITESITQAHDDGEKHFNEEVVDESIVLQQNILEYDLTTLAIPIFRPIRLYIERSTNFTYHTVVSGTPSTIVLNEIVTDDQYNNQIVSLYHGAGSGQWRTVTNTTAPATLAVSPPWKTNPDVTTFAVLRDPTYQTLDWYPLMRARWDSIERPTKMWLSKQMNWLWGMRMRLIYEGTQKSFKMDMNTTTIPVQWMAPKSRAYMHQYMISDNRSDAGRHLGIKQMLDAAAEAYHIDNPNRGTQPFMWQESGLEYPSPVFDPMNWGLGRDR